MYEYKQEETLRSILENDARIEDMKRKKDEIAKSRRQNAVEAKIRKDKIMQVLEKTKISGGKTAIKKILAQLSLDDDDGIDGEKTKKPKPISASKRSNKSKHLHSQKEPYVEESKPPSIIDICPPPEAVLSKIVEHSEPCKPYVSPYAPCKP